jgi:CcmD family protein
VTSAEQYVAAAYLVVFVLVLAYVLIIAAKLQRLERASQEFSVAREDVSNEPALEEPMRPAVAEPGQLSAVEAHPR